MVAYNLETDAWYYIHPDENNVGVYTMDNIPTGEYFLGATKEGYDIKGPTICKIKEGQQTTHTFYLRPISLENNIITKPTVLSSNAALEQFNEQATQNSQFQSLNYLQNN